MSRLSGILIAVAGTLVSLLHLHSQPKSLGAAFSFSSLGIIYEHKLKTTDSFIELALKAETAEWFAGRSRFPGNSCSLTWNMVFKEWESSEGNTIRLFAGPGVMIGYAMDLMDSEGYIFGLKGRLGGECFFKRNVSISLSMNPVLGSHIVNHPDHYTMKYYKNGLIYSIVPEIGIKYRF